MIDLSSSAGLPIFLDDSANPRLTFGVKESLCPLITATLR